MIGKTAARFRPLHPRLAAFGARLALPVAKLYHQRRHIHRPGSRLAAEKRRELRAILARGEPAYLAGIGIGGVHNTGVALIEIDPENGPRILCNNEEERFSGKKHTNLYPRAALEALVEMMRAWRLAPEQISAWLATWDHPLSVAGSVQTFLEEFPASLDQRHQDP